MLINQSNHMLEYSERYPIRLLSLPAEQQHMVQRLKMTRQHHNRSESDTPPAHLYSTSIPAQQLSSYRLHTQQVEDYRAEKRTAPTMELNSTIHSKGHRERPPRKLSILEERPGRSRLNVLKELMEKNGPFGFCKYAHKLPSETIKLQAIQAMQPPRDAISKIYRSRIQRNKKEKELRNALIISRVKQVKDLKMVIRKISSNKMVPI